MQQRLSILALALDDEHERLGWGGAPRLYGIPADFTWRHLDEGDPYAMLDLFRVLPDEAYIGLALVCEGWAAPFGDAVIRPSRHPRRERIRTVAVAGAGGAVVTTLRRRGRSAELLRGGEGRLLARLVETVATLPGCGGPGPADSHDPPSAA